MAISFTPEQQKVIELRDRNILVSAAAGSGKTAVLVERIIRMITDEEYPVDIDRLLVVTFTNAAAAEMRERISQAINKRLELTPESIHLQKQATLLHNAQITTIDSFCLFLIRNNFNDIGLDPGFRVADESEMRLLKQDVLSELLEQWYQNGEESFLDCVEYFTGGSNDRLLEEYISKLYEFSMSNPWPEEWIEGCKADYRVQNIEELEVTEWVKYLIFCIQTMVQECVSKCEFALRICNRPDGPYMYGELLEAERDMLQHLMGISSLQAYYEAFETLSFGRLPSKKDDSVNPACREKAQQLRNGIKKQVEDIRSTYLLLSPAQIVERMQKAAPCVEVLLNLVLAYKEMLDEKKRGNNIIDFHDMEHFALEILLHKKEAGSFEPSPAAKEYRQHFFEIMIDEYQDSNLVQELLLKSVSGEDEGHFNRFMVGDVKQSIYKFRLARPELFIEKYVSYSQEDSSCQRIDLKKNFRSRAQVLDSVNQLFAKIMGKQLGGIDYDEAAALYLGADFPQAESGDFATEYLIAGRSEESKLSTREQEAEVIAQKIKTLYRDFQVTDKETGQLRPVRYGDMVILLRTASGWADEFKKILEKECIPAYVASRTGYFQATEIRSIMQFLRVIDNPLQDIPLYGTMKSFFGGFSEEEIAQIRAVDKKVPLYDLLVAYEGTSQEIYEGVSEGTSQEICEGTLQETHEDCLQDRIRKFLNRITIYRRKVTYTPIHKLIQDILSDTGYLDFVTARPDGEQRRANVEMLLTRAAAFESTSYYGLFHFLRYMEQLEKYEVDYGEADVLDERADVVRIMSIHKSKGLEFPVCFVAGLSKKFNMQDVTGRLIADVDMGIGVDYVDSELRLQSKTLKKNTVAMKMKLDALGEEMRVLYVAMTRAREKLILTALISNIDKFVDELRQRDEFRKEEFAPTGGRSTKDSFTEGKEISDNHAGKVSFSALAQAGSYLDFIIPCLTEANIEIVTPFDLETAQTTDAVTELINRQRLLLSGANAVSSVAGQQLIAELQTRFSRTYPYEYLSSLFIKTTVSELKKKQLQDLQEEVFTHQLFQEAEVVPYIPSFISNEEGMSGTDRGSAYHKIMELLDLEAISKLSDVNTEKQSEVFESEINRQMDKFEQEEMITKQWRESISTAKIATFFESNLAKRMVQASTTGNLFREQPFVLGLPASRLGEQFPDSEQVLIQGIIDVFFEENGQIIVADYKTDAVKTPEELVKRYQVQLDYYAEALERLTGKKVTEKIIYSFALGQEILCL